MHDVVAAPAAGVTPKGDSTMLALVAVAGAATYRLITSSAGIASRRRRRFESPARSDRRSPRVAVRCLSR